MSALSELVGERIGLAPAAVDQLQAVVSDWQILADLSFADLLMFCRDDVADRLLVVAQMRPYTAQTVHQDDLVGIEFQTRQRPMVDAAFNEGMIIRRTSPEDGTGVPVREEAIPIMFEDEVIAVVARQANLSTVRAPSPLELNYLEIADRLAVMLAEGAFPFPGEDPERELAPRVGDGLLRLDPDGNVTYASPNAISAYRRLGVNDNVVGSNLTNFDLDDIAVMEALGDGEPIESEVEARGAVVLRRLLPLIRGHDVVGGLMLVREVTELRRHERLLLYKDATIREIHHRVKNNLQTVASLLRLQSRRLSSEEARLALWESVRRISSIALVHETLSQDSRQRVSFDKVASRLSSMLTSGLTDPESPVQIEVEGQAGELSPEVATPLALVLSELLQNAVEHAFPPGTSQAGGVVTVSLRREPSRLHVEIIDNGVGLPEGWSLDEASNLGLQIAVTLVESELGGELHVQRRENGGTIAVVDLPLPR